MQKLILEGVKKRDIANILGVSVDSIARHTRDWEKERKEDLNEEVIKIVQSQENYTLKDLKDMNLFILGATFKVYVDKVKNGYVLNPNDAKHMMSIYTELDKIERLDDGKPTENMSYELMGLDDIKKFIEGYDPFNRNIEGPVLTVEEAAQVRSLESRESPVSAPGKPDNPST